MLQREQTLEIQDELPLPIALVLQCADVVHARPDVTAGANGSMRLAG